jgi:putative ABC transport system permease protein
MLYAYNEFSYDEYHVNKNRIYRVAQNYVTSGKPKKFAITSPALGPALLKEFPQIESFVRIKPTPSVLISYETNKYYEDNIAFADTNIFKVFTYEFLEGNPQTCLQDPGNIVISKSMSEKYFGDQDPIGKTLVIEDELSLTVTGLIKDPPSSSHIPETAFISYLTWESVTPLISTDWSMFEISDFTYLLFYTDFDRQAFDDGWPVFYKEYLEEDGKLYGQVYEPIFHRLTEIHYHSNLPGDYLTGNRTFLYTLVLIGLFILVLAGINYTNMSTAKAMKRIHEAGMRKVMGSSRRALLFKFIGESFLMSVFTLVLAMATVEFIIKFTSFNVLIGTDLKLELASNPGLLLLIIGVTFLFSFMSSLYPAILLSRYSPAETVNNQLNLGPKGMAIRRVLVIFQLFLGTVAVIFTMLAASQIRYLEKSELGFEKENLLIFPVRDSLMEASVPLILSETRERADIISITTTWSYPGNPYGGLYTFEGKEGMEEHNIPVFFVNFDFLETLGLELIQGRDFDRNFGTDSTGAVLINETLANFMDWKEPLGKKIKQFTQLDAKVVGVVKDFHFRSLHHNIEPLIIRMVRDFSGYLVLRVRGYDMEGILDFMKGRYAEIVPQRPFEYFFLNERFNRQYESDRMQLKLISLFSVVCIIIASLGILGLVSYSVERRTREIGLRKVNGAHSGDIILQESGNFLKMVLLAFAAAVPVSILIFRVWLRDFAFKVNVQTWIILLGLALILIITQLTVYLRAQSAARMNPVDSIRSN